MFILINFTVFLEINTEFEACNTSKEKAGTGACYQFITSPFLLITLSKNLGTEDTDC